MIRPYRPSDCNEVLDVWTRASAVAHPFLAPEIMESELASIRDTHLPAAETWIWETDGRVTGFLSLLGHDVGAVFVEPQAHRSGIGSALIKHAARLRGDLEVEVFTMNHAALAFYAAMRFEFEKSGVHATTGLPMMRLRRRARQTVDNTPLELT